MSDITALTGKLNALCDAQPWVTSWYFKDLETGEESDRAGNVVIPSASTRKIAILMSALRAVNEGRFDLDQMVKIKAKYQDNNSGTFQHLSSGFSLTFQDLLVMMIIVSDNTSTGTIADMVGLNEINQFCQSIGMVGTTHRHVIPPNNMPRDHKLEEANTTTPNDVGLLLDLIVKGMSDEETAARLGCTPELCQLGMDILSWQKLRARMPAYLPEGTKVAHKTGTARRGYNDAGVIFRNDKPRYILTVYTDQVPVEAPDGLPGATAAGQLIAKLARTCWYALD